MTTDLSPPCPGARSSSHRHRGLPQPGRGAAGGRRGRRPRNLHQGVSVSPHFSQAHRRQHGPSRPRADGVRREREHGEELGAAQGKVGRLVDVLYESVVAHFLTQEPGALRRFPVLLLILFCGDILGPVLKLGGLQIT